MFVQYAKGEPHSGAGQASGAPKLVASDGEILIYLGLNGERERERAREGESSKGGIFGCGEPGARIGRGLPLQSIWGRVGGLLGHMRRLDRRWLGAAAAAAAAAILAAKTKVTLELGGQRGRAGASERARARDRVCSSPSPWAPSFRLASSSGHQVSACNESERGELSGRRIWGAQVALAPVCQRAIKASGSSDGPPKQVQQIERPRRDGHIHLHRNQVCDARLPSRCNHKRFLLWLPPMGNLLPAANRASVGRPFVTEKSEPQHSLRG